MKRLALLFALLSTFALPNGVFAINEASYDSTSSTTKDYSSQCVAGSYSCSCTETSGSTNSSAASATSDAAACDSFCQTMGADSFTYSCSLSSGAAAYTVTQGAVGSTSTVASEDPTTQTTDKNLITPVLNISIPGFSGFSDPTKSGGNGAVITSNFLAEYINAIYTFLLPAAALVAVVMMMIGGLQYTMARGKPKYIDKAKTRITNAITGMVLLLAAYNIAYLIDPQITDLKSISLANVEPIITEFNDQDIKALSLPDPSGGTNGVPYFSQRNYSGTVYGAKCDGGPTIATSGCGPTSAAMVLSYYGLSTDPIAVAASFEAGGYRVCNSGTSYAAFSKASIVKNNDFVAEDISISQHSRIESLLEDDKPILISVGPSKFTKHGHFMVLTGINSDGTFSLNDPNSGYQSATKKEIYDALKFATYLHKKE